MHEQTEIYVQAIRTKSLRDWLEAQERPYIKHALSALRFEKRISEHPDDGGAYTSMATVLHWAGNFELALEMFNQGLDISPNHAHGLMSRASLLATCPKEEIRNGTQAVADSEAAYRLAEETGALNDYSWLRRSYLSVIAASHAETGDFAKAQELLDKALDLCKTKKAVREVESLSKVIGRRQPIRTDKGIINRT